MEISNILLGEHVVVDPSTSLNNVELGDGVKISKFCSIFGSKEHPCRSARSPTWACSRSSMGTLLGSRSGRV